MASLPLNAISALQFTESRINLYFAGSHKHKTQIMQSASRPNRVDFPSSQDGATRSARHSIALLEGRLPFPKHTSTDCLASAPLSHRDGLHAPQFEYTVVTEDAAAGQDVEPLRS